MIVLSDSPLLVVHCKLVLIILWNNYGVVVAPLFDVSAYLLAKGCYATYQFLTRSLGCESWEACCIDVNFTVLRGTKTEILR